MPSHAQISFTLHRPDFSTLPGTVLLSLNRYGQLPAVLIDPIDIHGRVVPGTWVVQGRNEIRVEADYKFLPPKSVDPPLPDTVAEGANDISQDPQLS